MMLKSKAEVMVAKEAPVEPLVAKEQLFVKELC